MTIDEIKDTFYTIMLSTIVCVTSLWVRDLFSESYWMSVTMIFVALLSGGTAVWMALTLPVRVEIINFALWTLGLLVHLGLIFLLSIGIQRQIYLPFSVNALLVYAFLACVGLMLLLNLPGTLIGWNKRRILAIYGS